VVLVGCPSVDLAHRSRLECRLPVTCAELGGTGAEVNLSGSFALVVEHAVTTEYGQASRQIETIAEALLELEIPAVWQWPGPDAGAGEIARSLSQWEHRHADRPWHYFRRLAPERYYDLLRQCAVLIGNSSVGIRECSAIGVPVVNIGTRQAQRERGPNVVDVDYDASAIAAAVQYQAGRLTERVSLYGDGHAGERIAEVLSGH
jgi:UDP-N-acetylglucosamine 2-epimerase